MLSRRIPLLGATLALALCPLAAQADPTFTPFSVSGAHSTNVVALDNHGAAIGNYDDNKIHGFIRKPNGKIIGFDVPGAEITSPACVNENGTIAGQAWFGSVPNGFLRAKDGTFTTFGIDGANDLIVRSVNNGGWVAGIYRPSDNKYHSFVRSPDGTLAGFDVPAAANTYAVTMQSDNSVAGYWTPESGRVRNSLFLRAPGGTISTFGLQRGTSPSIAGVTRRGVMAGVYFKDGRGHGFLRLESGRVVNIDPFPTAVANPLAIGPGNVIVGRWDDTNTIHGFVFTAARQFVTLDAPGAWLTQVTAVNNRGDVAGSYTPFRDDGPTFGFIATP